MTSESSPLPGRASGIRVLRAVAVLATIRISARSWLTHSRVPSGITSVLKFALDDRSAVDHPRRTALGMFGSLAAGLGLPATWAQASSTFPDKPVRIIVPYSAGGGGDILARTMAPRLAERLGVPVVVENRPGAGGNLGTEIGLKSAPDGATLVAISSSYPCLAVTSKKLGFDPLRDYTPVALVSGGPAVFALGRHVGVTDMAGFVARARKEPGALAYGSAGMGSQAQFATELLALQAGISLNHIAYKGTSQAFNDLLAGNIALAMTTVSFVTPFIRSGRAIGLAVSAGKRLAQLPEVPTFTEVGLPDYAYTAWNALIAPRGLPREIQARLNQEINSAIRSREVSEKILADGITPIGGEPDVLSRQIESDIQRWREVARVANIRED